LIRTGTVFALSKIGDDLHITKPTTKGYEGLRHESLSEAS